MSRELVRRPGTATTRPTVGALVFPPFFSMERAETDRCASVKRKEEKAESGKRTRRRLSAMERLRADAPLLAMPPEAVAAILDRLGHADFCRARAAHRCFRVHSVDEVQRGRRVHHWLRLSPEAVCKAGRADILAFLYARKRVPRTACLVNAAASRGHADTVRVILDNHSTAEQRRLLCESADDPNEAMRSAVKRGDVNMVRALCDCGIALNVRMAVDYASRQGHLELMRLAIASAGDDDSPVAVAVANEAVRATVDRSRKRDAHGPLPTLMACARRTTLVKALLSLAVAGASAQARAALLSPIRANTHDVDGDDIEEDNVEGGGKEDTRAGTQIHVDLALHDDDDRKREHGEVGADTPHGTFADAIAHMVEQAPQGLAKEALALAAALHGREAAARFLARAAGIAYASEPVA